MPAGGFCLWLTANSREETADGIIVSEVSYALLCHLFSSPTVVRALFAASAYSMWAEFPAYKQLTDFHSSCDTRCIRHAHHFPRDTTAEDCLTRPQHE